MKNIILPALLAVVAVGASGTVLAQSAAPQLTVQGQLLSGTCTLSLSSNEIEFKNPVTTAKGTTFDRFTTTMDIACPAPTRFGITYTDTMAGVGTGASMLFRMQQPVADKPYLGNYFGMVTGAIADGVAVTPMTVDSTYTVVGPGLGPAINRSHNGSFMIFGRHLAVKQASATMLLRGVANVTTRDAAGLIEMTGGMSVELIYL